MIFFIFLNFSQQCIIGVKQNKRAPKCSRKLLINSREEISCRNKRNDRFILFAVFLSQWANEFFNARVVIFLSEVIGTPGIGASERKFRDGSPRWIVRSQKSQSKFATLHARDGRFASRNAQNEVRASASARARLCERDFCAVIVTGQIWPSGRYPSPRPVSRWRNAEFPRPIRGVREKGRERLYCRRGVTRLAEKPTRDFTARDFSGTDSRNSSERDSRFSSTFHVGAGELLRADRHVVS